MKIDSIKELSASEKKRLGKCPVKARFTQNKVESLSDYISVLSPTLSYTEGNNAYWFRGHRDLGWELVPSALRFDETEKRDKAVDMIRDFQRIAETKIRRPPPHGHKLEWMQIAQHYGVPTRLLDWTESAIYALFFACYPLEKSDGMVFHMDPSPLTNHKFGRKIISSFGSDFEESHMKQYFELKGSVVPRDSKKKKLPTLAIKPVWNSPRLLVQRGAFTFHGSTSFSLDNEQVPSLVGLPIFKDAKQRLLSELESIGVDELTLFPELEYVSNHLKRKRGLINEK